MGKLRICLISNLYPPYARGGAERVVATIAHALKENGQEVFVITTVPSFAANMKALASGGFLRETVDGVIVYRIATANLFPYWTIGEHNVLMRFLWHVFDMFAFETAATVRRILRKEKPDVVMTHNLKGIGFLIPRAIRRLGIRHIHTAHDVQLAVPSGLLFANEQASFIIAFLLQQYEHIVRWLIGSPDVVIFPSQWLRDFYEERGFFAKSKKVVLYNPVEIHGHLVTQDAHVKDAVRFLYVGQLEQHKGILLLIEAIKRFQIASFDFAQDMDCRLQIDVVGTGSLLQKIQKEVQDDSRIRVHGAVTHEKLSEFYANADALIVPSLVHENAPTVIFEAFAHGLPVIASRVGGIPEFVKDGETGWLFDANNPDALCAILERLCSVPQFGASMRINVQRGIAIPESREYIKKLLAS